MASVFSGMYSDRLGVRSPESIPKVTALAALMTIPCIAYAALTGHYWVVIALFAAKTVAHVFVNTPGYALTVSLAAPQVRGTTTAVLQVLSNLFGYGAGPQLIGLLSDGLHSWAGADSLRYGLAIFVFLNIWSAVHFMRAAHWMRHAKTVAAREAAVCAS